MAGTSPAMTVGGSQPKALMFCPFRHFIRFWWMKAIVCGEFCTS
jgi:hypothetical protein